MISVNGSLIGNKIFEYVNECLRTEWIPSVGRFIGMNNLYTFFGLKNTLSLSVFHVRDSISPLA